MIRVEKAIFREIKWKLRMRFNILWNFNTIQQIRGFTVYDNDYQKYVPGETVFRYTFF